MVLERVTQPGGEFSQNKVSHQRGNTLNGLGDLRLWCSQAEWTSDLALASNLTVKSLLYLSPFVTLFSAIKHVLIVSPHPKLTSYTKQCHVGFVMIQWNHWKLCTQLPVIRQNCVNSWIFLLLVVVFQATKITISFFGFHFTGLETTYGITLIKINTTICLNESKFFCTSFDHLPFYGDSRRRPAFSEY